MGPAASAALAHPRSRAIVGFFSRGALIQMGALRAAALALLLVHVDAVTYQAPLVDVIDCRAAQAAGSSRDACGPAGT